MYRQDLAPLAKGEVIAERYYELATESGEKRPVVLRIGRPKPDPRDRSHEGWMCPLEIQGLGTSRTRWDAPSVDALGALVEAFLHAHLHLRYSEAHRDGRLSLWDSKDLFLPGRGYTDQLDLSGLFENRAGYRGLITSLLRSSALYGGQFRRLLGARLSLPLDLRHLEVATELALGEGAEALTIDTVCYPHPSVILAFEIALDGAGASDVERTLLALRGAESKLAHKEGRSPRAIHVVVIGAEQLSVDVEQPDVVTALPWGELSALFDRCDHLEGDLSEHVLSSLSQAAVKQASAVVREPSQLSFPVGERIFEALRQAKAEFQRHLDADPELSGTVWHCQGSRGEGQDDIYGWFRPMVPRFRARWLLVRARRGRTNTA